MALLKFSPAAVVAIVLGVGTVGGQSARAFDIFWLPAGSSSWNTGANWSDVAGGSPRGVVPNVLFEEVGVINNGGTATLTGATIAEITGGVSLGQTATDTGTLTIGAGGIFTSQAHTTNTTINGIINVGVAGRGTLNVTGGTLNAVGINIGGLATSQANLSGTSIINLTGATTVNRGLRITGPSVNYSSTGVVNFGANGVFTPEITAATHSPIKTTGTANLNGTINVQFNGTTPAVGTYYNLVDAATINGNFANGAIGADLTVTGAPAAAVGSAYRLRTTTGGANGRLLQVGLENLLVLRVNRDTGELTLRNPLGAAVTTFDGYTIASPTVGSLVSSYKGISGAPAGDTGWEKATGNSATGLAEFKPSGVFNVSSNATNISLGTGFSKTAVASQGLGVDGENLTFTYHARGGNVVTGQVEYVGTKFLNNIALVINTTTGIASLKNDTIATQTIDGYSILSSTGALNGTTWNSLADRPATFPNWQESPVTTGTLSETNPVSPLTLAVGQSIPIGNIGDFTSAAAQSGLSMKFILGNESSFRLATISFTSGAATLSGDFDNSGKVDGRDFLVWQRGGSPTPNSASDLATWRTNFGAGGSVGATSAVPEPSACALLLMAIGGFAVRRRRVTIPVETTLGGKREMIRYTALLAAAVAVLASAPKANCAVTLGFDANQPVLGTYDQSQLLDDATIPGGTTPVGAGTYNSQAYTDNGGPPGQTFTAPPTKYIYALTAVSVKTVPDTGGVIGAAGVTWGLRISEVNGTNLTPLKTVTGIPTVTGAVGGEWFTFAITGTDVATLAPNKVYAFETFTSAGYLGIDATQGDANYAGGTAFNSAGAIRTFVNNTLGNQTNHGYDRTFITQLTAPPFGPGDADNSGTVNIADYNLIKANLEKPVAIFTNGDLDGNSYVDLNDFRRWRVAAGPALAAQVSIPEPSSLALALVGLIAGNRLRRRRREACQVAVESKMEPKASKRSLSKLTLLLAVACLAILAPAAANAQSLGLKFASDDPADGTSLLNPTDVAGVVPIPNWNNLTGPNGTGVTGLFYNNAGTPVSSGVSLTWTSPNTWRAGANNAFPVGPNKNLLNGYLDTNDTAAGGITLTVTGIDAALRSPAYDVYVYFVSDSNANRGGGYTLNDGNVTLTKFGSTQGSPAAFLEDPGNDPNLSVDGNYLRFRGFTGTSFTLTTNATLTNPNGFRAPVNAIQIVGGVPIAPGPADVNEDGQTNIADYNIIKANFFLATGATRLMGDLSLDGRVDLADYAIWRNIAPASVVASAGVPEPGTLSLAAGAVALLAGAVRRTRRSKGSNL